MRSRRSTTGDIDVRKLGLWWSRKPQHQCRGIILSALLPDPTDSRINSGMLDELRNLLILSGFISPQQAQNNESILKGLLKVCIFLSEPEEIVGVRGKFLLSKLSNLIELDNLSSLDPFAGGGAIPIEAQRLGLSSIAGEYNPFASLMLRASMEIAPVISESELKNATDAVNGTMNLIRNTLNRFYEPHGELGDPLGYINFRRLVCEGPGCGYIIPATSKFNLDKNRKAGVIFFDSKKKELGLSIVEDYNGKFPESTIRQGNLVCPVCGYVTRRQSVYTQLARFGLDPIIAVAVYANKGRVVFAELTRKQKACFDEFSKWWEKNQDWKKHIPFEKWPITEPRRFSPPLYGYKKFSSCHTKRQLVFLGTVISQMQQLKINDMKTNLVAKTLSKLLIARLVDLHTSFCRWRSDRGGAFERTFSRSGGVGMMWDFFEANPFHPSNSPNNELTALSEGFRPFSLHLKAKGTVIEGPAQFIPMPDNSVDLVYTDPPYFDSIPYSHLSDWINIWVARVESEVYNMSEPQGALTDKKFEVVVDRPHSCSPSTHDSDHFKREMTKALTKSRIILKPDGIAVIVFAHTSTAAWESLIESALSSGYVISASWPIRTERGGRIQAQNKASLESSVHLICRPREDSMGSLSANEVGDWRDVLDELPGRIHEWMPRLASEGVVGADAIFACLGPALEIFSRYSSVEKASGEKVELKEYLEHVWAAVAREALNMIFEGADASGFEEDARLTAMWLWTLRTSLEGDDVDDDSKKQTTKIRGYDLEYDAARKIAQGLGAHLENLKHLVEIKGDTATLLSASARTRHLFGKDASEAPKRKVKEISPQKEFAFMKELRKLEEESTEWRGDFVAKEKLTILDQLHQAMILFGAGRSDALKRFLIDEGIGRNPLYWRLAQSLSALYPPGSEEKRWVDGVLARKKGLGL